MKSIILLVLLITFQINLNYDFDYHLEYESTFFKSNTARNINYYINSKTNDYYISIWKNKNNESELYFRDQDTLTGLGATNIDLKNPGTIILPKRLTNGFNLDESLTRKYKVERLKDTVINKKSYSRVIFKMANARKEKRKRIGYHIYVFDTSVNVKPLFTDPHILNCWSLNKSIPKGLMIEKHVFDFYGQLSWCQKLKKINPVDFSLIIE